MAQKDARGLAGTIFGTDWMQSYEQASEDSSDVSTDSSDDDEDDDDDDDDDDPLMRSMKQFQSMLREHDVPPFASWDEWASKLQHDERFHAVCREAFRRRMFDEYVRRRVDEMRDQQAQQKARAVAVLDQWMCGKLVGISARTAYADACKRIEKLCEEHDELVTFVLFVLFIC